MYERYANWIDGAPRPALSAETFDVTAGDSAECVGRWPRSGERDLAQALVAARAAEAAWRGRGARQRRELLAPCVGRLCASLDPGALLALRLGLQSEEIAVLALGLERELGSLLAYGDARLARAALGACEGPFALVPDWSELWLDPARDLLFGLLSGRPAILLGDGQAPMIADAFARALEPLPPGVFALVHDDGLTCMRAAVRAPGLASLHVSDLRDESGEIAARIPRPDAGSGALAVRADEPTITFRHLSNASFVARASADPAAEAACVVRAAFSRAHALSGARPGQIGRVFVPQRVFSRFQEHLLQALEQDLDVKRPIPLVERLLAGHVERAFALGHDEGATAIYTGPNATGPNAPLVFTNVEGRMRLSRRARPAPVLCLLRVRDEAAGGELAARLEGSFGVEVSSHRS